MDSKKTLEKYLKPSGVITIIGWILLIASVAMLVMGILSSGDANTAAGSPEKFDKNDSETGAYAYVDAVGISDWVYKIDSKTYYVVLDKRHNAYVVRVKDSELKKMDDQNAYFMENDAAMPKAYTLKGVVRKLSVDDRNEIAGCFDMSSAKGKTTFGTMYLDATATPGDDAFALWLVGFILCFTFGLIFVLISLPASANFKKCIRNLEARGLLDAAAAELESGEYEKVGKDCGRLSRRFFFGKNSGMVLPYTDIQWIYRQNVKRYFITLNVNLIVSTLDLNQKILLSYNGKNRDEELNKVFVAVAQNNPNVLLGFTSENQKAYKERKKAAKLG